MDSTTEPVLNTVEEVKVEVERISQPKKSFFRRFIWLWIILGVGVTPVGVAAYSGYQHDKNAAEGKSDKGFFSGNGDDEYSKLDERVAASFLPESGAAFKYNSPTIVGNAIYIGTSQKFSYEGDHAAAIASLPNNYFYKMDLNLNVIWQYPLEKTMVVGAASLDSKGNIYFATELFIANENAQDKESFFLGTLNLVSLPNDGKLRWKKPFSPSNEKVDHVMFNPAIGVDDTIYIGHDKFYAFDTEGNIKWQYPADDSKIIGFSSSPVIDSAGNIYFISPEPVDNEWGTETIRAYKFTPGSNGKPTWATTLGNELKRGEGPTK